MHDLGSPVTAFARERCRIGPTHQVLCEDLFNAWCSWNDAVGRTAESGPRFGKMLRTAFPHISRQHPRNKVAGEKEYVYAGIALRPVSESGEPDAPASLELVGTSSNPLHARAS